MQYETKTKEESSQVSTRKRKLGEINFWIIGLSQYVSKELSDVDGRIFYDIGELIK